MAEDFIIVRICSGYRTNTKQKHNRIPGHLTLKTSGLSLAAVQVFVVFFFFF